jgi:hypothetical protein
MLVVLEVSLTKGNEQKNHRATLFLLVQHLHLANYGEVEIMQEGS